jgi:hypothetical protein
LSRFFDSEKNNVTSQTYVSQSRPRYFRSVCDGFAFSVANQAVVSTTAGLATTWTGLAIGNPAASGVNVCLTHFFVGQVAAGVAGTVGLMGGAGAITASLTVKNRLLGATTGVVTPQATASAGQTISTPILIAPLANLGSVATTGYGMGPGIMIDLAASIVIPPGSFIATYTTAATTSALVFAFFWEEELLATM